MSEPITCPNCDWDKFVNIRTVGLDHFPDDEEVPDVLECEIANCERCGYEVDINCWDDDYEDGD